MNFNPNNQATWPEILSTAQVAEIMRESTATIYDLAAAGVLPCLPRKHGQKVRVPRGKFLEWLGASAVTGTGAATTHLLALIRERGVGAQAQFVSTLRAFVDGQRPEASVIENQFELLVAAQDSALVERAAAQVLR